MNAHGNTMVYEILARQQSELLTDWLEEQASSIGRREGLISMSELREQSAQLLDHLKEAARAGSVDDIAAPEWRGVRDHLADLCRSRVQQGFSPSEIATFVLSLKRPLFNRLRTECGDDANRLADEVWTATELLDKLGLYTTEIYLRIREEIIARQQEEMLELSTPVVRLWEGILALPVIGTLDSARTQVVMETLLNKIVETGSQVAIIDITGVPTVDTLVAQHLLKTVTAARLMGADCIISGIRPAIAQTIVHLGVDLADVTTKASLADAFILALQRIGDPLGSSAPRSVRD